MTWHRVWLIKCNGDECAQGHVTDNPAVEPEGWGCDGTHHLCPDCRMAQVQLPVPSDDLSK